MACQILSVEGAVFVLWGRPTQGDLERVVERVEQVAAAAASPIVFIARVPQDAPAPDADVRTRLNELMPRFARVCSSYHAVLEGGGFVCAFKRAILAGLFQFGFRSGTFFVHDTDRDIMEKIVGSGRVRAEAMLTLAAARGLLTAGPPPDTDVSLQR